MRQCGHIQRILLPCLWVTASAMQLVLHLPKIKPGRGGKAGGGYLYGGGLLWGYKRERLVR